MASLNDTDWPGNIRVEPGLPRNPPRKARRAWYFRRMPGVSDAAGPDRSAPEHSSVPRASPKLSDRVFRTLGVLVALAWAFHSLAHLHEASADPVEEPAKT